MPSEEKPKRKEIPVEKPVKAEKKGYVCKICGYLKEGDLPADFICPICKHGAIDFDPIN